MLVAAKDSATVGGTGVDVFPDGDESTVIARLPKVLPLAAMIDTVPAATPVTLPVDETVATAELLLDQDTGRSLSTLPAESITVAAA
jgi:hypothetical protein